MPHLGNTPKLLVAIAVDQMRYDYLKRFAPFETGGLHRLFSEGASFSNALYDHIPTETGPGHSIMLSGRNSHLRGTLLETLRRRCCETPADRAPAPANFHGESLSDQLHRQYSQSRFYTISLKDRTAILMEHSGFLHLRYSFDLAPYSCLRIGHQLDV